MPEGDLDNPEISITAHTALHWRMRNAVSGQKSLLGAGRWATESVTLDDDRSIIGRSRPEVESRKLVQRKIDGGIMGDGFQLADREFQVEVVYRNRKTMEIRVLPSGLVRVVAPRGTTDRFIRNCLAQKAGWIREKLAEAQARERLRPKREYTSGEVFLFLGEEMTLTVAGNALLAKATVRLDGQGTGAGRLIVETPAGERTVIQAALEEWYRQKAFEVFTERIEFFSERIGKKPERIKLSNAKKRWGSCTSKGTVLLNWRVVMAPAPVIDYLVVHELSHLKHLNHSGAFWRQVAEILPDYQESKDWLQKNGYKLLY